MHLVEVTQKHQEGNKFIPNLATWRKPALRWYSICSLRKKPKYSLRVPP